MNVTIKGDRFLLDQHPSFVYSLADALNGLLQCYHSDRLLPSTVSESVFNNCPLNNSHLPVALIDRIASRVYKYWIFHRVNESEQEETSRPWAIYSWPTVTHTQIVIKDPRNSSLLAFVNGTTKVSLESLQNTNTAAFNHNCPLFSPLRGISGKDSKMQFMTFFQLFS